MTAAGTRFHGLDVIRLVAFFAIASFHISLIHYHTADITIASESFVIRAIEQTARILAFSGFTIAFLTSLLTALSGGSLRHRARLFTFLIFGWFVFSALMQAQSSLFFVWDIYPLLFIGILSATLCERYAPKYLPALGLIGFCMLWVPFWDFMTFKGRAPDIAVVLGLASCAQSGIEWPVLPWIGLPWAGYVAGHLLKQSLSMQPARDFTVTKHEWIMWLVLLAASTPGLGGFYQIRLGEHFSCEAYRQPPLLWWAHFVWVLFVIRLAIAPQVQARLHRMAAMRWISSLAVSRKFWLAYFLNYLLAYQLSWIVSVSGVEKTSLRVPVIAAIGILFLPLTELVTRAVLAVAQQVKKRFKRTGH